MNGRVVWAEARPARGVRVPPAGIGELLLKLPLPRATYLRQELDRAMESKKRGRSRVQAAQGLGRKRPRRAAVTRTLPHCTKLGCVAQIASDKLAI